MDPRQLKEFRAKLVQKREELLSVSESGRDAAQAVEVDQGRVGRLSRMDEMRAQAMAQETGRRRGLELQRIAAALERLEADEYGLCLSCGREIGPKRLEIDPAAVQCIECAEASG